METLCSSVLHAIQYLTKLMVILLMLNPQSLNLSRTIFRHLTQPPQLLTINSIVKMWEAQRINNANSQRTSKTQMIMTQMLFMCLEWSFWHLLQPLNEADTLSIITTEKS